MKMIPGKKATIVTAKTNPSNPYHYKSQFEKDFSHQLLLHKREGLLPKWEYEKDKLIYKLEHTYVTDFRLEGKHGKVMYIETKGYFKSKDRTKHKKLKEQHPNADVRFIFMNSKTKLNKNSTTTYGSWCTKQGFKYADRKIPIEWLMELNKE
jgi:hypothetical protein